MDNGIEAIILLAIFGLFLFFIIAFAVKLAVKDALYEFKEDVIKELSLKKEREERNDQN